MANQERRKNQWWSWLSAEKNQRTLAFIGSGLAITAAALWGGFLHFSDQLSASLGADRSVRTSTRPDSPSTEAPHAGNVVVEQNVVQGSGNVAVGVNAGTISPKASESVSSQSIRR